MRQHMEFILLMNVFCVALVFCHLPSPWHLWGWKYSTSFISFITNINDVLIKFRKLNVFIPSRQLFDQYLHLYGHTFMSHRALTLVRFCCSLPSNILPNEWCSCYWRHNNMNNLVCVYVCVIFPLSPTTPLAFNLLFLGSLLYPISAFVILAAKYTRLTPSCVSVYNCVFAFT